MRVDIDPVSKRLIAMLQVDGRCSYAELAHRLGVPEDGVEKRVVGLVESGVIEIAAVCEPQRVGLTALAMLGIICESGMGRVVAEKLADRGEFVYIVLTAGSFDLMAEVYTRDEEHLRELVEELRAMPGVLIVQRYGYRAVEKQIYTWGVR